MSRQRVGERAMVLAQNFSHEDFRKQIYEKGITATLEDRALVKNKMHQSILLSKNIEMASKLKRLIATQMELSSQLLPKNVTDVIDELTGNIQRLESIARDELDKKPVYYHLADRFDIKLSEFKQEPYASFFDRYGSEPPNQKELRLVDEKLFKRMEYWVRVMRERYHCSLTVRDIIPASNK